MLVNSFTIPDGITNRAGQEAWACAFLCFRACDMIMCSSGVCSLPFFSLAISRVSLNSALSREHVCCHVFPPAHVFPSGLGNIPVTEVGGSPFPHGGVILDVGGFPEGSVVCDPTACDNDAGIISICSSASTNILASYGKKPWSWWMGGRLGPSSISGLICQKWVLNQSPRNCTGHPEQLVFFCPVSAGQWAPVGVPQAWLQALWSLS